MPIDLPLRVTNSVWMRITTSIPPVQSNCQLPCWPWKKLNKLSIIGLDRNARLEIQTSRSPQKAVTVDSTSADLKPSIAQYIKKIFLVSDNDAYNRLYEFLGQEYFNTTLRKKGYKNTRILHRLGPEGAPFKFDDNQYTNAFSFYNDDKLIYHQGEVFSKTNDPLELLWGQMKGTAHVNKEEVLVQQPFNFKQKNYFSLQDLHDVLKAVIFPRNTPSIRRFQLKPDDYSFLYQYMSQVPRKSDIPAYADKADNYVKFFWNGDKPGQIPDNIKIFNKVGWAYGFLTDVSYIIDTENNIEYMLAATIHVNKNETYNDGEYEYETVGLPFFSKLGQAIYERELKRRRKRKPDFAWLLD